MINRVSPLLFLLASVNGEVVTVRDHDRKVLGGVEKLNVEQADAHLGQMVEIARETCLRDMDEFCPPFSEDDFFDSLFFGDPVFELLMGPPPPPEGVQSTDPLERLFGPPPPPPQPMFPGPMERDHLQRPLELEGGQDTSIDLMLDRMMDVALNFATLPPPRPLNVKVFKMEEEEQKEGEKETDTKHDEGENPAVKVFDNMLNSFIDRVASASASASADMSESAEKERVNSRESEEEKMPMLGGWSPAFLSNRVVEHGKQVLEKMEQKQEEESDDHPELRRRLARRLTEVSPDFFVSIPVEIIFIITSSIPVEPVPWEEPRSFPRLGFGCDRDVCLWNTYDNKNHELSPSCAMSLTRVRDAYDTLISAEREQDNQESLGSIQNPPRGRTRLPFVTTNDVPEPKQYLEDARKQQEMCIVNVALGSLFLFISLLIMLNLIGCFMDEADESSDENGPLAGTDCTCCCCGMSSSEAGTFRAEASTCSCCQGSGVCSSDCPTCLGTNGGYAPAGEDGSTRTARNSPAPMMGYPGARRNQPRSTSTVVYMGVPVQVV